jgi:hypothetical protein
MIAVYDYSFPLILYLRNCFVNVITCLLQNVCTSFWWRLITDSILERRRFHKVSASPCLMPPLGCTFLEIQLGT